MLMLILRLYLQIFLATLGKLVTYFANLFTIQNFCQWPNFLCLESCIRPLQRKSLKIQTTVFPIWTDSRTPVSVWQKITMVARMTHNGRNQRGCANS
jgi:hypothetical protein